MFGHGHIWNRNPGRIARTLSTAPAEAVLNLRCGELRDGRWVALEIKIGEVKVPGGVRNIERLRENVASNPAARNPRPEFSAAVTAMSMCSPLAPCGRNGMGAVLVPKEKPLIKSCRGAFVVVVLHSR